MSDQTSTGSERSRAGQGVANPRRLRLGADGRPLAAPDDADRG